MAFFDPIGRFFFLKNRPYLFFCLLSFPFLLAITFLTLRMLDLSQTEKLFDAAALKGKSALEKRIEKEHFLSRYSDSDPYFIDQYLEAMPLMQDHLKELRAMKNHPACRNRDFVAKRIAFLEGSENRLSFAEENIRSSKKVKETEERLIHSVEIDTPDLDRLLSLIEDVSIGSNAPHPHSPQLLIQDFTLTKKEDTVYDLNLSLIKREFNCATQKKN